MKYAEWKTADILPEIHAKKYTDVTTGEEIKYLASDDVLIVVDFNGNKYFDVGNYVIEDSLHGWCSSFGNLLEKVTHWTPLPDMPEESEAVHA